MREKPLSYFILYKPFGYLSQFSGENTDMLLGDLFEFPKDVYPVGRLDKDSEGLLLLTNDNFFKTKLLNPEQEHYKTYWVQVEGSISEEAIKKLSEGLIEIKHQGKSHRVKKAKVKIISDPDLPERDPPIRFRKNVPTSWIEINLSEGKNRQVRKMTAAAGFPTLRLVRVKIGALSILGKKPGFVAKLTNMEALKAFLTTEH